MLRRIFVACAVFGVLLAATSKTLPMVPERTVSWLLVFFCGHLFVQLWPLFLTLRGHWGNRKHPVNKMYAFFSAMGILGTLGVMAVVFLDGELELLLILAGPTMFLGVMGSAVLAFFATPWRDWTFRDPALRRGKAQRSRLGVEEVELSAQEEDGRVGDGQVGDGASAPV